MLRNMSTRSGLRELLLSFAPSSSTPSHPPLLPLPPLVPLPPLSLLRTNAPRSFQVLHHNSKFTRICWRTGISWRDSNGGLENLRIIRIAMVPVSEWPHMRRRTHAQHRPSAKREGPGFAMQSWGIRKHMYGALLEHAVVVGARERLFAVLVRFDVQLAAAPARGGRKANAKHSRWVRQARQGAHTHTGTMPRVLRPAAPGEPASEARAQRHTRRGRQAGRRGTRKPRMTHLPPPMSMSKPPIPPSNTLPWLSV